MVMPSLAERRTNVCRHYLPVFHNPRCDAGVCYKESFETYINLPCTDREIGLMRCPMAEFLSEEEAKREDRRIDEELDRARDRYELARGAIVEYLTSAGRLEDVVIDAIACPCCQGGTLQFAYEGEYTKHTRAKCSTQGCAAWVE